jgi:DNA repair exonuclease SbcCD nuclease subunit
MYIKKILFSLILLSLTLSIYAVDNELTFCVTGDSRGKEDGINKKIINKIIDAVKKEKPSFVVVNGDLVNGYSSKLEKQLVTWRDTFMPPLLDAGIKVYSCRGNHDAANGKAKRSKTTALKIWQKVFSDKFAFPDNGPSGEKGVTYFIKSKNVLLLVFDSYTKKMKHKVNTEWMSQVLQKEKTSNSMHVFVMTHEPAFSVQHKDCLESNPKERDKFLELFLTNGGRSFFCGHDHFYNHAKVELPAGEFHQFVCGTLGAPLYKWKEEYSDKRVSKVKHTKAFGYMVVHIKGNTATLTMKAWNNKNELETIDTFSYTLK